MCAPNLNYIATESILTEFSTFIAGFCLEKRYLFPPLGGIDSTAHEFPTLGGIDNIAHE